jgi:tetraacyldisaccharide 4'-kinase
MRQALQRAWLHRGLLAWLLWPLSLIFGLLAATRRAAYRTGILRATTLPVPVIVVGNVVAGGAGKTPVTIALVRHLQARGIPVGIVSRGYGRRDTRQDLIEVHADSLASEVGDEPLLVHRATGAPLVVGRRRAEAAQHLLARHPAVAVIVSDDGLQHLALSRDIEICVFDARGVGNRFLLPAGLLREPWPRPVDFILHTGTVDAPNAFILQRQLAGHAADADGNTTDLSAFAGQPVTAVAGIAQPQAFFDMLAARGIHASHTVALDDHHDFSGWQPPEGTVICTEKDAVKIWPAHPRVLAVVLEVTVDEAFWHALDARLSSLHGHQTA